MNTQLTNLTDLEKQMIEEIANSDYREDGNLASSVWQPVYNNQDKGVLGSLVKKGIVWVDNTQKGYETVMFTELGIEIYNSKK